MTGVRVVDAYLASLALVLVEVGAAWLFGQITLADAPAAFGLGAVVLFVPAVLAGLWVAVSFRDQPFLARFRATPRDRARTAGVLFGAALAIEVTAVTAHATLLATIAAALAWGSAVSAGLVLSPDRAASRPAQIGFGLRALLGLSTFAAAAVGLEQTARRADLTRSGPIAGWGIDLLAYAAPSTAAPPAPVVAAEPALSPALAGFDVLFITAAGLRADHLGVFGHDRAISPNLDRLAGEGVRFEACYASTPDTLLSLGSLFAGKRLRPLWAMDLSLDVRTLADELSSAGYATIAFSDEQLFDAPDRKLSALDDRRLGFKRQRERASHQDLLAEVPLAFGVGERVFAWVHLDTPREPYRPRGTHTLGARAIDRYDAQINELDRDVGALITAVRARSPSTLVVFTAAHGEAFGEHDEHHHGGAVYEEQVRVPLLLWAPAALAPLSVSEPVNHVDVAPTLLGLLAIEALPLGDGRDLSRTLRSNGASRPPPAPAYAETDEMVMLGEGQDRLICLRRSGVCSLYDLRTDPRQRRDAAARLPAQLTAMQHTLEQLEERLFGVEALPLLAKDPRLLPVLRARAFAGDSARAIAPLLEDKDPALRRRAARELFELRRSDVRDAMRSALLRETDAETKSMLALGLVRLGDGAPLVFELFAGTDLTLKRLAALALAENGDDRGEDLLNAWLTAAFPRKGKTPSEEDAMTVPRAKDVIAALAGLRSEDAVSPLLTVIEVPALRGAAARALARIGEDAARPKLAELLYRERYLVTREALLAALLELGAGPELREPLVSLLGLPDPHPGAVRAVSKADLVAHVGGPARDAELSRLRRFAKSGVSVDFVVPELTKGASPAPGAKVRVVCRANAQTGGELWLGARGDVPLSSETKAYVPKLRPELDKLRSANLPIPPSDTPLEIAADLPDSAGARPGKQVTLIAFATQGVVIDTCQLVPRRTDWPDE